GAGVPVGEPAGANDRGEGLVPVTDLRVSRAEPDRHITDHDVRGTGGRDRGAQPPQIIVAVAGETRHDALLHIHDQQGRRCHAAPLLSSADSLPERPPPQRARLRACPRRPAALRLRLCRLWTTPPVWPRPSPRSPRAKAAATAPGLSEARPSPGNGRSARQT